MKGISKINEKIYILVQKLRELSEYELNADFNTREGMICANIKVYQWLDESNVEDICKELQVKKPKKVLKEFNEERLTSIHEHVCEVELNHLKEKYEEYCDITDFSKVFRIANLVYSGVTEDKHLESLSEYLVKTWKPSIVKFDNLKDFKNSLQNDTEFKDWTNRELIDKFEIWQYGRSGGWLSICSGSELDFSYILDDFDYDLPQDLEEAYENNDNNAFNKVISFYGWSKSDLICNAKEQIKGVESKIKAVRSIVDEIEQSTKYFKEILLDQLHNEINEFIGESETFNASIFIDAKIVKTNLGVSVPVKEFSEAFKTLSPSIENLKKKEVLRIDRQVGKYFVEFAKKKKSDTLIKAGCHRFSYNQMKQIMSNAIEQTK